MKVLTLTDFLPVPSFIQDNDVVVKLQQECQKDDPSIEFATGFIAIDAPPLVSLGKKKWATFKQVSSRTSFELDGQEVTVFPYFTKRNWFGVEAVISQSVLWKNRRRFHAWVEAQQVDLIHAHSVMPDGWLAEYALRSLGIPYLLTLRQKKLLRSPLYRFRSRHLLGRATERVCITKQFHDDCLQAGISSHWIPHGVGPEFFRIERSPSSNPHKVLCISKLIPLKNLDSLIRVMARLPDRLSLTLVGSGVEEFRLKELCGSLSLSDRIQFIPRVDYSEVPALMASHDLFVMPSRNEVFGRVYIEALATGMPVVYGKGVGIDGIWDEEDVGAAVEPGNDDSLYAAMDRLLSTQEHVQRIAKTGSHAVEPMRWSTVARRYNELYRQIAGAHSS